MTLLKIAFGCDHAGFNHKNSLIDRLKSRGYEVKDFGCYSEQSCDYTDIAASVAAPVSRGEFSRGILLCGTGIGMSIAANKFPGVRAAVCWCEDAARLSREHNDANILCLPARFASPEQMIAWIDAWLTTPASENPRHQRRIGKITELETKHLGGAS